MALMEYMIIYDEKKIKERTRDVVETVSAKTREV